MKTKPRFPTGIRLLLVVLLLLLTVGLTKAIIVAHFQGKIESMAELTTAILVLFVLVISFSVALFARDPSLLKSFKLIMKVCAVSILMATGVGIIGELIGVYVVSFGMLGWLPFAAILAYLFGRVEKQARRQKGTGSVRE